MTEFPTASSSQGFSSSFFRNFPTFQVFVAQEELSGSQTQAKGRPRETKILNKVSLQYINSFLYLKKVRCDFCLECQAMVGDSPGGVKKHY